MEFGIRFNEKEYQMLMNIMEKYKIKTKGQAIKKCIEFMTNYDNNNDMLLEMNDKLNRIIYRDTLTKKLLEQFFSNMGFVENVDTENDKCLYDFYSKNDRYKRTDF